MESTSGNSQEDQVRKKLKTEPEQVNIFRDWFPTIRDFTMTHEYLDRPDWCTQTNYKSINRINHLHKYVSKALTLNKSSWTSEDSLKDAINKFAEYWHNLAKVSTQVDLVKIQNDKKRGGTYALKFVWDQELTRNSKHDFDYTTMSRISEVVQRKLETPEAAVIIYASSTLRVNQTPIANLGSVNMVMIFQRDITSKFIHHSKSLFDELNAADNQHTSEHQSSVPIASPSQVITYSPNDLCKYFRSCENMNSVWRSDSDWMKQVSMQWWLRIDKEIVSKTPLLLQVLIACLIGSQFQEKFNWDFLDIIWDTRKQEKLPKTLATDKASEDLRNLSKESESNPL